MDVEIFENLRPHSNLRHLTIEDYGGSRFPTWLEQVDHSSFPKLESFSLYNLKRCESLPPLGQFLSLKHLQIENMYALKSIDNLEGTLSSLKYLKLWNLPDLEEWLMPSSPQMFPSLESLIIVGCPKLKVQPHLPSSLLELEMKSVREELLGECLSGLSRLRKLKIAHFEESAFGRRGLQYLTALEELEIMNCYMTCLQDCIPQIHFPFLRTLKLTLNNDLELLGNGGGGKPPVFFSELRHLKIQGCDELTHLPEWLAGLTSLQSLELSYCDKLTMLPHAFPFGFTSLTIHECPLLYWRYQRDIGCDWPKLSHIPEVQISLTASSGKEELPS